MGIQNADNEQQYKDFVDALQRLADNQGLQVEALLKVADSQYMQAQQLKRQASNTLTMALWYMAGITSILAATVWLGTSIVDGLSGLNPFSASDRQQQSAPGEVESPISAYFTGKPLKRGDVIGAYTVGDTVGLRQAPTAGASTNHRGTDIPMPTGTALYAPAKVTVKCQSQPNGAGNYATFQLEDRTINLLHLSSCIPGRAEAGTVIAKSGNTGISTGAHLDIQVIKNGSPEQVTEPLAAAIILNEGLPSLTIMGSLPSGLDTEQAENAAAIVATGQQMGMSQRDIKIALMTAFQESSMRNLNHGDDWYFSMMGWGKSDSVGLFQQRDSWGSKECRTDPPCAATLFYNALRQIPHRSTMSLTEVAATVQKPAKQYRGHYTKWESQADAILSSI